MTERSIVRKSTEVWKWVKLKNAGEIVSGGTPSTVVPEYWNGDISWISPSDLTKYKKKTIERGAKSITHMGLKNSSACLIPKGSVLFSSRAPIGYVVIANNNLCTNQGFKSVIPNENVLSDFLYYFLLASKSSAEKVASGTTFKEISLSKFRELDFPLPPIPIQQAIVSKIEELFSELDKGIENLLTAQQQLKTYRQSVLKWAFEGRLTNENIIDGKLPTGWHWYSINELGKIKGGKRLPPNHQYSDEETEYIYIMAGNLKEGTVTNKPTYIKQETYQALINYKVSGGEVYITIVGACIGDAGIIPESIGKSILTENAAKIIDLKSILNKYLAFWINSTTCQATLKSKILSATLGKLALNRIGTLEVPVPSLIEQQSIIEIIETRLSIADKMEESITQSLQQAAALRQSILKKAFEGKLVIE